MEKNVRGYADDYTRDMVQRTLNTTKEELNAELTDNISALYPEVWEQLELEEEFLGKLVLLRQEGDTLVFVTKYDSVPAYLKLEMGQILVKIPSPPSEIVPRIKKYSGDLSYRMSEIVKKYGKQPVLHTPSGIRIIPDNQRTTGMASQVWQEDVSKWDGVDDLYVESAD